MKAFLAAVFFMCNASAFAASAIPLPVPSPVPTSCDVNIFARLNASNLLSALKSCSAADAKAALQLATDNKYTAALNCLTPGVPIILALDGQDANGNPTGNGLITAFVQYGLFVQAGGPGACISWVNGVVKQGAFP